MPVSLIHVYTVHVLTMVTHTRATVRRDIMDTLVNTCTAKLPKSSPLPLSPVLVHQTHAYMAAVLPARSRTPAFVQRVILEKSATFWRQRWQRPHRPSLQRRESHVWMTRVHMAPVWRIHRHTDVFAQRDTPETSVTFP